MTRLKIVGLCGPKYCGKDSAGQFLANLNIPRNRKLFRLAKMAQGVKNIVEEVFGWSAELYEHPVLKEVKLEGWPYIEPRWPLMDIANWMRDKYGGDVWARRWERVALQPGNRDWGCHVITDVRFPEELEMMSRHNSRLIYIERPEAEEALTAKQKAGDAMALNQSESHYAFLRDRADIVIRNDRELHNLRNDVQSYIGHRCGWDHWTAWNVPPLGVMS